MSDNEKTSDLDDKIVFRIKADFTFLAYDIDDAFAALAKHFIKLNQNEDDDTQISGKCEVKPLKATYEKKL